MKILVLLESPGKVKKISQILNGMKDGNQYTVKASMGHITRIEDSGKYKLGLNMETYEPKYEILSEKKQVVKELKKLVKENDMVYLASDDDREGSMISAAWIEFLDIPKSKQCRVLFHEITEKGVKEGLQHKGSLDENMVEAAKTRAILDKILGYMCSPLAKYTVGAPSVGRVQSAGLKIIADREREIQAFKPEKFYEIYLSFNKDSAVYTAKYKGTIDKKVASVKTRKEAEDICKQCLDKDYKVSDITSKIRSVVAKPPFTTSLFQQDASAKLGYSPKKAMQIAQKLYESGYITYMRTDSLRFSDEFISDAKKHIISVFGKEYYKGFPKVKQSENAQEAHESIRPTHIELTPDKAASELEGEMLKVYKLIFNRSIAALMSPAEIEDTNVTISNKNNLFGLAGHIVKFPGFKSAYNYSDDSNDSGVLPTFKVDEKINPINDPLEIVEKQTTPPSRYTEATLISKLETEGIGRPSTYATVVETLKEREYMTLEKKSIICTDLGLRLSTMLDKYFPDVINLKYTAEMEKMLDEIAEGQKERFSEVDSFYKNIFKELSNAKKSISENKPEAEEYDDICPECGKKLVIKTSKYGKKFVCCSGYPKCKFTASLDENGKMIQPKKIEATEIICPKCKKGHLVKRTAKATGEVFYGCSNFSKGCKFTMKQEEFEEKYNKKK